MYFSPKQCDPVSSTPEYKPLLEAFKQSIDWNLARKRAFSTRSKAIENLDKHLIDFETHFTRNQGKIIWAPNAEAGKSELISQSQGFTTFSMEHGLLDEMGLSGHKDWHYSEPDTSAKTPRCLIVFPDFYISENGSLALHHSNSLTEKWMADADKIIFVCGIEQVCPTMNEAENLIHLLALQNGFPNDFPAIQFSFGNRNIKEKIGPKETYVLMLDNGRSELLAAIPQRQALYCIHCGACSKFSNFDKQQSAPLSVIDALQYPFTIGPTHFNDNFMFPLSGRATEACPVNIDLKGLVLENRKLAVDSKLDSRSDALAWKAWKTAMMSRKWLNKGGSMKNFTFRSFYKKPWGNQREFPKTADQSFNEWWQETRGKSEI
ncbi:MAG: hypothetical protein GC180_08355 [Bacteroidetes bacterium]|nr:hypothetical protein [Bacteroidota bacterium]